MDRRRLLVAAGALGAGAMAASRAGHAQAQPVKAKPRPFKLRYAPHPGMFKHHAPGGILDEIKFAADQGFTAWEDNGLKGRPIDMQEKIAAELAKQKMTMGIFVLNGKTGFGPHELTSGDPASREAFLKEVQESVDVAKRVNGKWITSLVGNTHPKLPRGYQFANVIDNVRRAADILEPHGLVMVFEPLNIYENHPGFFIPTNDWMYALMKAVNRPSCKMLYDLYHSQIGEGHLIYNFDKCFDEIAYVQTGDTPGRNEPYTGEVNYKNVLKFIFHKGYTGIVGMEHGLSKQGKEGELAVIKAYRDADDFPIEKPAAGKLP